jgi:hypothetical protein
MAYTPIASSVFFSAESRISDFVESIMWRCGEHNDLFAPMFQKLHREDKMPQRPNRGVIEGFLKTENHEDYRIFYTSNDVLINWTRPEANAIEPPRIHNH